jgi:hypothetical protein
VQQADDFAALVRSDEELASALAEKNSSDAFIAEVTARASGLPLPAESVAALRQSDPIGVARWVAPSWAGSALPPRHWLPVAVASDREKIVVDWAWLGPEPLRSSFYESEIRRALALPFNRVFRYRTSFGDLVAQIDKTDHLDPDGFIFHMSRCGSTLAAQMVAATPYSIVISEAAPIDTVLQLCRSSDPDLAAQVLRAIITAFGRKRAGSERRYVVKLDAWHTLALPLFRRAFPDVPWVFLYRDPVEVMVSQMRQRGMQLMTQYLPAAFYGIDASAVASEEDYCARVLATVCRAAIEYRGLGGGRFVNYRELPDAVFTAILPHFGICCSEAEIAQMRNTARRDAKSPGSPFTGDADAKQTAATEAVRQAAEDHLGGVYATLEKLSKAGGLRAAQAG